MKICIACSGGGHLTEILQIRDSYESYSHFYITFKRENSLELSRNKNVYFVEDPEKSVKKIFKCGFQTIPILIKEKPDIVISTGAGVAIPSCILAKILFRSKIIFIESFCRIDSASMSGKILYHISDLFFVQWKKLLKKYGDKAMYKGAVI